MRPCTIKCQEVYRLRDWRRKGSGDGWRFSLGSTEMQRHQLTLPQPKPDAETSVYLEGKTHQRNIENYGSADHIVHKNIRTHGLTHGLTTGKNIFNQGCPRKSRTYGYSFYRPRKSYLQERADLTNPRQKRNSHTILKLRTVSQR